MILWILLLLLFCVRFSCSVHSLFDKFNTGNIYNAQINVRIVPCSEIYFVCHRFIVSLNNWIGNKCVLRHNDGDGDDVDTTTTTKRGIKCQKIRQQATARTLNNTTDTLYAKPLMFTLYECTTNSRCVWFFFFCFFFRVSVFIYLFILFCPSSLVLAVSVCIDASA